MRSAIGAGDLWVRAIGWIARTWSAVSLGLMLLLVFGEILSPHAATPSSLRDFLGLLFFPAGVAIGLALSWRWEGLGGAITLGSLVAFYGVLRILDGKFPRGPYLILLSAPGMLFLACWIAPVAWRWRYPDESRGNREGDPR